MDTYENICIIFVVETPGHTKVTDDMQYALPTPSTKCFDPDPEVMQHANGTAAKK